MDVQAEWLLLLEQAIENLEQGIDNRLTERITGLGNLSLIHVACRQRQVAPLFSNDGTGTFDRPLSEVCAIANRCGFHADPILDDRQ